MSSSSGCPVKIILRGPVAFRSCSLQCTNFRVVCHHSHGVGNHKEVINDDKKFAVALDVSHFKPGELKVHLDGRDLTIEGQQELKTDHGYVKKSFVHKWALPEDCDLDAVHTQLDNEGHLSIEAPKTGQHTKSRVLLILSAPKKK
ncbi:hypothetical protein Q1695_001512 [Nippostrongylus brasiliensis]|nr:hypothetical protein Q1695_001512 [Nippostrongylus brasiliensis]